MESLIGYLRDRKSASGSYLTRRAPLFIDSAYADLVWNLIDRLTAAASSHTPALAYVRGVMHSRENDRDAAVAWLTKAWSLVQDDEALLARIGLELGLIYLRSADLVAADAIVAQLEWREKRAGGMPPDVLLLQGLLFEARNELKAAEKSYRSALSRSDDALTPATRVMALLHLASSVRRRSPHDAIGLCEVAVHLVDHLKLRPHLRVEAQIARARAYLCYGHLQAARSAVDLAQQVADSLGARLLRAETTLLVVILDELDGQIERATSRLAELRSETSSAERRLLNDVVLREAWLALESGRPQIALDRLGRVSADAATEWRISITRARCSLATANASSGRAGFLSALGRIQSQDDELGVMTMLLWSAHASATMGRRSAAAGLIERAWSLGASRGFVVAPDFWSREIVVTARTLASGGAMQSWAAKLVLPARPSFDCRHSPVQRVSVAVDGQVTVEGEIVPEDRWRHTGTGSRVLRRYLGVLAAAYPRAISQTILADMLWPDSDGDRARSNLYEATSDLRRALRGIEGIRVAWSDSSYSLVLGENATISITGSTEARMPSAQTQEASSASDGRQTLIVGGLRESKPHNS